MMMAITLGCVGQAQERSVGAELASAEANTAARATLDQIKAVLPPAATTLYVPEARCSSKDTFTPALAAQLASSGYGVAASNTVPGAHYVRYELSAGKDLLVLRLQIDNSPAKAKAFFRTPQGLVGTGGWTAEEVSQ